MSTTTAPTEPTATDVADADDAGTGPTPPAPPVPSEERSGPTFEAIAVLALVVAFVAVIVSIFAMGLAARSIDEHRAIADGGGTGGPVAVSLTEFAIAPAPISASSGGTLSVTNDGSTTHDLSVEDQDLATAVLDAGGSEQLSLAGLAPGTYTVFCSIPGHRASGMETQITVG